MVANFHLALPTFLLRRMLRRLAFKREEMSFGIVSMYSGGVCTRVLVFGSIFFCVEISK